MPLFAGEDERGLYIQVGVIGYENYDHSNCIRTPKLVYGRKWRIEGDTPSSEVIQTVFLAIQKAREHEIREWLTWCDKETGKISAPFSCHQDLPLMAANKDLLVDTCQQAIKFERRHLHEAVDRLSFEQRPIRMTDIVERQSSLVVDIAIGQAPLARHYEKGLAGFEDLTKTLILDSYNPAHFLYALMDALIAHSNQWVEEHFTYKNFSRFKRDYHPASIAALSIATRPYRRDERDRRFSETFQQLNYQTDASRVPQLGVGRLAEKNTRIIGSIKGITGHMPIGYAVSNSDSQERTHPY